MRREERVTVQGPVKKQQPDGMSHGGELGAHLPDHLPLGQGAARQAANVASSLSCSGQSAVDRSPHAVSIFS